MENRLMLLAKIGILFCLLSFANLSFAQYFVVDACTLPSFSSCHVYPKHKKIHRVHHVKSCHVKHKHKYIYTKPASSCNSCGIPADAPERACLCSNCDYCSDTW